MFYHLLFVPLMSGIISCSNIFLLLKHTSFSIRMLVGVVWVFWWFFFLVPQLSPDAFLTSLVVFISLIALSIVQINIDTFSP